MSVLWEGRISGGRWTARVEAIENNPTRGTLYVSEPGGPALLMREVAVDAAALSADATSAQAPWVRVIADWVSDRR